MARFARLAFVLLVVLFADLFSQSNSGSIFRRGLRSFKEEKGNSTKEKAACEEEMNGIYPCSSTITGNVILMVFYGAILGFAAKCISDGAELLLDVGVPASIVGGIILPLLGAVPDSAIIIVSGMGPIEDAQRKLSVGMGTLAGSTIMLLTAAWAGSVVIGRCDLDRNGEAIEGSGHGKFSCVKQGVTVLSDVRTALLLMLGTSTYYLIVQGADWHFGANNFGTQPAYVRKAALATMIICLVSFVLYLAFLAYDSKEAKRRAERHKQQHIQRKVLHHMLLLSKRTLPTPAPKVFSSGTDEADEADGTSADGGQPAKTGGLQKKYFKAWHMGKGLKKAEPTETDPILPKDNKDAPTEPEQTPAPRQSFSVSEEGDSDEEKEESPRVLAFKSVGLLVLGVGLVTIFADPMCDVLDSLTNPNNHSHIPISAFYVSFVVTPLCSNASELVSSLLFAAKKKKENVSMTFSQLYGAGTMNNTLCLGIFAALVYFRELKWFYSAEVFVIIFVQWLVGLIALRLTYKVWMAGIIGALYVVSIGLVALLESKLVGWK